MPLDLPGIGMPSFGGGFGQPRSALRSPLSPDQEQSMNRKLLGQAQGALSYTLGSLNKPGRAVRGMLAGKFHEGLAAIPFSDSLGITNPNDEVTGKKLLQHHGLLRPGDNSWGAWGAGLATDLATDPLTYFAGPKHALTAGGRALEKMGALKGWGRRSILEGYHGTEAAANALGNSASDITHMADQGRRLASPAMESAFANATGRSLRGGEALGGLARFSVPFKPDWGFNVGTGRVAQAAAGGMDRAGDFLKFGNPISRAIGDKFNTAVHRATDYYGQKGWANSGHEVFTDLTRQARANEASVASPLDQMIRANPQHEAQILRAARIGGEGSSPLAYLAGGNDPKYLAATKPVGVQARDIHAAQLEAEHNAGLLTQNSADKYISYLPRQATAAAESGGQLKGQSIVPTASGANIHREEMFRDLPGGTDRLNDQASRLAGSTNTRPDIVSIFRDFNADHLAVTGSAPSHSAKAAYLEKARQLSDYYGSLPSKYMGAVNQNPLFSHGLSSDVLRRSEQHARTMGSSSAITEALSQAARPVTAFGTNAHVPMNQALAKLGLGSHDLGPELTGAGRNLYRKLAPNGAGNVEPLVTGGTPYALNGELAKYGIDQDSFDKLSKQYPGWQAPEEMKSSVGLYDSFTNTFKATTYPLWLASHVRNAGTAGLNGLRLGTTAQDYALQARHMTGKLPESISEPMRRGQYANINVGAGGHDAIDLLGTTATAGRPTARTWQNYAPGTNQHGLSQAGPYGNLAADTANLIGNEGLLQHGKDIFNYARSLGKSTNPWGIAGVGSRKTDSFAPLVAGRTVSGKIEDFMRGAQYQGLLRQGHSPGQAADLINKYHFDYSAQGLTPFERNVAKRAMPFYRFSRGNLPLQAETILQRPGAFTSPFAATRVNRDKDQYTPDYMAAGFAAPLGKEVNGSQRFLSSLGLPQEEALKEMSLWNGTPDLTSTATRFAGNLNPLIKAPLEQIADRQFYSGRKLSDLRPSSAASSVASLFSDDYAQPLSQLISNTPLTRFATSLDKLMDTKGLNSNGRKPGWATALNLGTGVRVTDVDLNKQKFLEQRAALDSMLKGSPNVTSYNQYYVQPENKGQLTPVETLQLRKLGEMQESGRRYAEQRRQRERLGL